MKYLILIHSNPDPWGHPTQLFTPEGRAVPAEQHAEMEREWDAMFAEIRESGEFVTAEALGDPATAAIYTWTADGTTATDGPYAEAKEQLAGFFVIDVETRERAEQLAAMFAGPGSAAELRPVMTDDAPGDV